METQKAQLTFAQAAEKAGLPVATLRDWFNTSKPGNPGPFKMGRTDQSAPPGGTRYLSVHTTLAIAIAAAFTRLGVSLPRAAHAGMMFAHAAGGTPKPREKPGALYGGGTWTMISVPAGDAEIKILAVSRKSDALLTLTMIGETGATILPIDPIFKRVCDGLDWNAP